MPNFFEFELFLSLFQKKVNENSSIKMNDISDNLEIACKNKYWLFNKIYNKTFFKNINNEILIDNFIKINKFILFLKNKIKKIKRKKYINFNDFDLVFKYFEKDDDNIITLYLNNTKYLFRNYELHNICLKSLLIDSYLFPTPQIPKNPYTNIQFSQETLFIIYFKLVDTKIIIDPLITSYFKKSFDINNFLNYFDGIIQDRIIDYNCKNNNDDEFWKYEFGSFINFINNYVNLPSYIFNYSNDHSDFINFYINPIRKFLKSYLLISYSKLTYRKETLKRNLIREFRMFLRSNFNYGRIYAVARRINPSHSPRVSNSNSPRNNELPNLENANTNLSELNTINQNEIMNLIHQQVLNQLNNLEDYSNNIIQDTPNLIGDTSNNTTNTTNTTNQSIWNIYFTEVFNTSELLQSNNYYESHSLEDDNVIGENEEEENNNEEENNDFDTYSDTTSSNEEE